jgi:hypothetical protein
MSFIKSITVATIALFFLTTLIGAQTTRRTKPAVKKPVVTNVAPAASPSPVEAVTKTEPKKNARPGEVDPRTTTTQLSAAEPTYFYEFAQPDFTISKIAIEHDEAGRGTITFIKKLYGDAVTEPIQLSPAALERIKTTYDALNFVDSTESYQYEKDYSHLGVMTFRLKKGERQRTAVFNYTVNKNAKLLVDEYRKIGNQFIWVFDIGVARENQPLETPKLLSSLEALLKRNDLSDPTQLVPVLKTLIDDERVPLISRNHAKKLAEKIEKSGGKD